MVSVMSYCIVLFFSLGFDGSLKELPYLDFLKHLAGPPVSSWSAVEPLQGPTVGSPEPVEDIEELSPKKQYKESRSWLLLLQILSTRY